MKAVLAFVRLGRPQFLGGGFLFYGLGAAVAAHQGAAVHTQPYVCGQLAVTAFQLMTHYANDYFDLDADRANATPTRWSGGSRVLLAGVVPRSAALIAALVLAALGLGITIALGRLTPGPPIVPALLAVAAIAWAYSAPPLRLHSRGLGELATALVVTVAVPFVAFQLQVPTLAGLRILLLAVVPPFLLQVAMMLAIEFPDAIGDAAVGKRTLVVRLGGPGSARLYAAVTAGAFVVLPALAAGGLPWSVVGAVALLAPLGLWRVLRVARGDWSRAERWEALTFWGVALVAAIGAVELAAFVWTASETVAS